MKMLRPREQSFWNDYLAKLPSNRRPRKQFVEAAFAGCREGTDALIHLYRLGKKTAGSSLVKDFESEGDPLPKVGSYWIMLDSHDCPQLIAETIRTEINSFGEIPESIAQAEGEGDMSVSYWKKAHRNFYLPFLAKWGIADIDKAQVITEHFEIVHEQMTTKRSGVTRRPNQALERTA